VSARSTAEGGVLARQQIRSTDVEGNDGGCDVELLGGHGHGTAAAVVVHGES
jgi:hypothetical protein